jgi:hypothetical protein
VAATDGSVVPVTAFVGGVSELFQGDLDLGRLAVEQLLGEDLGPGVLVEDLHYGAVAVAQRLEDVRPGTLVLVGAVRRGRAPGTVERRRIEAPDLSAADLQAAVRDAVVGYVHVDLVVAVAAGLRVLPPRTVAVEVEPEDVGPGEGLSSAAAAGLVTAVALVRDEVRRSPLLQLADELRPLVGRARLEDSGALRAIRDLLEELVLLDREGRWGAAFALRDRLRLAIAAGEIGEGMDHRDWGLWWALIEELDRLEAVEAVPPDAGS